MLSREEWSIPKVQPDVFSLGGLIAWLEEQPAHTEYRWYSAQKCLAAEYLRAVKGWDNPARQVLLSEVFESMGQYRAVCGDLPWTFGAALSRARAQVQPDEQLTSCQRPEGT